MTAHDPRQGSTPTDVSSSKLIRIAIWVAIGALIAAALVCVVWVLVGPSNDVIGRAFLTIFLLAAFAGVTILEARLAPRRPAWFALTSMVVWVVTLIVGAFLIWLPYRYDEYGYSYGGGAGRFLSFLLIVLILQLALLHVRLYSKAYERRVTTFTRAVAYVTVALLAILSAMLVFALMLNEFIDFGDWYWRLVVAIAILVAVGTALLPLMNVLFAPRAPRAAEGSELAPWPTYVDGQTPLPMLPDGSPDWIAYYTGYPSPGAQVFAAPQPLPAQPQSWQAQPQQQWAPQAGQQPEQWPAPQPEQWPARQAEQWPAPHPEQQWNAPQPAPQRPGQQWPPMQPPAPAAPAGQPQPQHPDQQARPPYEGFPPPPPLPPQR